MTVRSSLAFSLLFAAALHAQSTPPPSGAFVPPITGYAGRYLDSAQTPNFQANPTRTLRAQLVKVAPERGLILMKLSGSLFGVYDLSAFAARAGGALDTGGHGEKYLPPDVFSVDPEHSPDWTTFAIDAQNFLFDFDYDDRGYFYLAYSSWGFGIVDSSGVIQSQVVVPPITPLRILAVRDGTNVRAIISDAASASAVYDVTNPAGPVFLRTLPFGIVSYAKLASGGVAVVTASGALQIYATGGDLAAGNPPAQTFTQPGFTYTLAATDGVSIFATVRMAFPPPGVLYLSVLTPSAGVYTETRSAALGTLSPVDLHYGAGYIVVSGVTFAYSDRSVLVFRRDSLTPVDLTAYFVNAYPPGSIHAEAMAPYASGRATYLIAALFGVGELFTLSAAPASAIPAFTPAMLIALAIGIAAIALSRLR